MEKIASFTVDHRKIRPWVYISRVDGDITTYDIRMRKPNTGRLLDNATMHSLEHLFATMARNSELKDDVIYFGPMGCRTGFYLVMFGALSSEDVFPLVSKMCKFILAFEGPIPGATPKECGNFSEQNLNMAKFYISRYLGELQKKRFTYPE